MPITLNNSNISVQYNTGSNYIIETVKSDLYNRLKNEPFVSLSYSQQLIQKAEQKTGVNGWIHVKHLPNSSTIWYSGNDNLQGNLEYNQTTRLETQEWSIKWDKVAMNQILFTKGSDLRQWLHINASDIDRSGWHDPSQAINNSHDPNKKYVFYRNDNSAEQWTSSPYIFDRQTPYAVASSTPYMIYQEQGTGTYGFTGNSPWPGGGTHLPETVGYDVFVRSSTSTESYLPAPIPIGIDNKYFAFKHDGSINENTTFSLNFPENTSCDILIVGGGGGGGYDRAGGGGAGGLLLYIKRTINAGAYTIKVGKGGIGDTGYGARGTLGNGFSSSIEGLSGAIALGGGRGGTAGNMTNDFPASGGSGGGGAGNYGWTTNSGSSGTSGQGNNGGNMVATSGSFNSAGGGGAGGNGGNGLHGTNQQNSGNGGVGVDMSSYFGTSFGQSGWFAGGGGGSLDYGSITTAVSTSSRGGQGGGGNAGLSRGQHGSNGLAGTGGGGGGGANIPQGSGGSGGSGIVIVRYNLLSPTPDPMGAQWTYNSSNTSVYHIGNVGIGTTNPQYPLDVRGNIFSSTGGFTQSGLTTWSITSDRRIKENIVQASYDKCLENVKNIELYNFNFKDNYVNTNDIHQLGFIAQEVQQIYPKAVEITRIITNDNDGIDNILSLNTTQIKYTLYGAVKKLIEKVENIESKVNILYDKIFIKPEIDTSNLEISSDTSNLEITNTSNLEITSDTSNLEISSDTSNLEITSDTSNLETTD